MSQHACVPDRRSRPTADVNDGSSGCCVSRGYGGSGRSTLTVGTPTPARAMTAVSRSPVGLTVYDTGRHVDEIVRAGVNHRLTAGTELQSHRPADHMEAGFVVTVVVPARRCSGLGVDGPHRRRAAARPAQRTRAAKLGCNCDSIRSRTIAVPRQYRFHSAVFNCCSSSPASLSKNSVRFIRSIGTAAMVLAERAQESGRRPSRAAVRSGSPT
jgi:hypothetical protein